MYLHIYGLRVWYLESLHSHVNTEWSSLKYNYSFVTRIQMVILTRYVTTFKTSK